MDVLSEILQTVSLAGALYLNAEFTAPWCIGGQHGPVNSRERLAGAEHVLFFHFLVEGRCQLRLADSAEVIEAAAGDVVLFPQDDRHLIGSDVRLAPVDTERLVDRDRAANADFIHIRHGGGGDVTRFVCGYMACNRSVCRPLLESLPRLLRITVGQDQPASRLLRELLRTGVRESHVNRPGADSLLAKLSELLLVEALRRHVERLPADGRGWLAGVRDPRVGRALALLHGTPHRDWTVDTLAREVALSRSALAERFSALVGESPVQYLLRWRLALAARALRGGSEAIARVAERSGYESEAAFSRAFKREFGVPPRAWRTAAVAWW
ncbi:MAG TPA: AraC family transcriptional regulator [Burkholderiaceae bacterium]|nr:AraC family transcriptional regulator [Burkholderiaceae bacterium]